MLPARVALSPDGGRVLVAPRLGRQWHIWDVRTQRIEGSTDAAGDLLTFQDAEFGPDGNTLVAFVSATGTEKLGRLLVIDVPGGAVRARPEINFRVSGIDFTPQGRMLVLEDGGRLGVWTTDDWREICGVPLVTGYGARLAGAVRASADGATVRAVIGNTVARWSAPP